VVVPPDLCSPRVNLAVEFEESAEEYRVCA